jgi:predicted ATP-grasp superfamily ATP-dependent carboligase
MALSIRPVNYSGPGSIITSFTLRADREGIEMATLVAEVPTYIEGYNPRCVVTMIRCLGRLLNQSIDTTELQKSVYAFDREFDAVLENQESLKEQIKKLEEKYDNEEFNRDFK